MSDLICICSTGSLSFNDGLHASTCPARELLPHESALAIEHGVGDFSGDRWLYAGPDIEIGMVSEAAPSGADRWARFFQAAPLMARALLKTGAIYRGSWHTHWCDEARGGECTEDCEETRAALTAAGVPLQ